MKSILFSLIFVFALANVNALGRNRYLFPNPVINQDALADWRQSLPQNIAARRSLSYEPVPAWGEQEYWGTGASYAGFIEPDILEAWDFPNQPATIAVSPSNKIVFINDTASFLWAGPTYACIGSPGYPSYIIPYATNASIQWTYYDEVNGYTQAVHMASTLGDEKYTTRSFTTLTMPAKGATVTISIGAFLPYTQYQRVIVVDNSNSENYFQGKVVSYVGRQLTLDVIYFHGSGTISSWDVYVSGERTYTGPSYDMSSCMRPMYNTFTTYADGVWKAWSGYELYNILQQPGFVDKSASNIYFDTIYREVPPAAYLLPPAGCGAANSISYCAANLEQLPGPFPSYIPYPGPEYESPYLN